MTPRTSCLLELCLASIQLMLPAVSIPMEGVLMSSESVSAEMPARGFFQDYKLASYSKLVLSTQSLKESS
ncbi:hypothetical protein E2N91_21795 [Pseudomonas syringae pv. tomato]|nr:hypothetical protein E2N91_21795 [Pseudomonas syringae pv. tomato]TES71007.1 hypothetical protein E2N89_31870 [Pseudomonas syringae pv. tomato]